MEMPSFAAITGGVKALQRWLKAHYGYTGAIDGIAGSGTRRRSSDSPTPADPRLRGARGRRPTVRRTAGPRSDGGADHAGRLDRARTRPVRRPWRTGQRPSAPDATC
ncbi:hypothetical protein SMICM17S_02926 [Streptomyces microflavus]